MQFVVLWFVLSTLGVWIHREIVESPERTAIRKAMEPGGWGHGLEISGRTLDQLFEDEASERLAVEWAIVQVASVIVAGVVAMVRDALSLNARRRRSGTE
ncbi:MAG TPA: hypothetical protein VFS92_06770 [Planctomycetota bacterium]|nr:hypothetical protein [Planctomycetota bacterium]